MASFIKITNPHWHPSIVLTDEIEPRRVEFAPSETWIPVELYGAHLH